MFYISLPFLYFQRSLTPFHLPAILNSIKVKDVICMDFSPLVAYIEDVIRSEKGVPCCDIIIKRHHETLFRYQSGTCDYDAKVPVSGKELYYMYSCTKPVTCTAALQLVEQGLLELDAPVSRYLPEYADAFVLKDGVPTQVSHPITIRHLFTMTAGLTYDRQTAPILQTIRENPNATTKELVSSFIRSPLSFEPGLRYQYSLCHDVLAAVIEVVSGLPFSAYMKQNIFGPLDMADTGFIIPEEKKSRLAAQFTCPQTGLIIPFLTPNSYQLTPCYESGGAGLYSSVEDYSRFTDAMANYGEGLTGARILKPETVDLMRSEQMHSFVMNNNFSTPAGPGYGYGLGVRTLLRKDHGERSSLGEFGWDGAAGSYMMMDPAYGLSIFFAMHVLNWPTCIGCGHAPMRDLTYEILGL